MEPNVACTDEIPERVGRYEILLPIASGGMATVYLARSVGVGGFEREVALKLTHPHLREDRGFAVDLIEEAKLAVRIRHPNVVSVLDAGEDPRGLYLVMDYVEGCTLATLSRAAQSSESSLSLRIGLRILVDVLAGLQAAHELRDQNARLVGLVHRDFSPQNILVGMDGIAKLTDFGIAKAANRLNQTSTGVVKGKVSYMAPEQAQGQPLDRRCDVWAAGVVAWELVVGRRPHDTESHAATLLRIVTERAPRLREIRPDIPADLDEVVYQALCLDPMGRIPSAAAMARQLVAACEPHGLLADVEEVAQCVSELVGPRLEQRRRQAKDVARRHDANKGDPIPQPDALPRGTLGSVSDSSGVPVVARTTSSPRVERPKHFTAFRVALVTAAVAAVVVVVGLVARARGNAPSLSTAASPPSSTTVTAQPSSSSSAALIASSVVDAAPALDFLTISADTPMRSLQVEGRVIPVSPPSRTLSVQVSVEGLAQGIEVQAESADGRVEKAAVEKGAHAIALKFGKSRLPPSSTTGKLPLAPNPYAHVPR